MNKSELEFQQLVENMEKTIKIYRGVLAVVRAERDILVAANLDDLSNNNVAKEKILLESKKLESERHNILDKLLAKEGLPLGKIPTLKELATYYGGDKGERLRHLHSVLEILVNRVRDINSRNEKLVKSALSNITGAMKSIKDLLDESKTYEKKGKMQKGAQPSGHFVSKQV